MAKLLDRHRLGMIHALGLDRRPESYRNHYVADPGSPAAEDWRFLVGLGYATEEPSPLSGGMIMFRVTPAGRAALSDTKGDRHGRG